MAPPRPPLPGGEMPPPRPPLPAETDDEDDMFMHAPQPNQPIMVMFLKLTINCNLLYARTSVLYKNIMIFCVSL